MPSDLTCNINSQYFEAANHLRPKRKPRKVIVYVESYDDIFFWRDALSEFEDDSIGFEIVLPSRTNLNRGKKSALLNHLGNARLGTSMIACVDADYDYLLQGYTPASKALLERKFIVHTQVYSIENYQCYAPSLHKVCVMATLNDRYTFDFQAYLETYSRIVYPLFTWAIWMFREGLGQEFPMSNFCNITKLHKINIFNPEDALERLRKAVNRKVNWLQQHFPQAKGKLQTMRSELETLGLTPDDTYLYIQGHHLMDNIVMEVMTPVCNNLRRAREKEIKQHASHAQQMENELASYQHSQGSLVQMLRRNTDYKQSAQYQTMRDNIVRLIDEIKQSEIRS